MHTKNSWQTRWLSCAFLFGAILTATIAATQAAEPAVIFITLDGVRTEEVHSGFFPETIAYVKETGFLIGKSLRGVEGGGRMKISNYAAVSLPGYRALLSGRFDGTCRRNDCGRITKPTLFDDLPDLGIARDETAVFASWDPVGRAVTERNDPLPGSVAMNDFRAPDVSDRLRGDLEKVVGDARRLRPSWSGSRWDRYTWQMAFRYLEEKEPRLTYISLVDTDEWAHISHRGNYEAAILDFDRRFTALRAQLAKTPGRLERTSFVITTDHGRGFGPLWSQHRQYLPHSKRVFSFVIPSADLRAAREYSPNANGVQSQIRATVEELLSPGSRLFERQDRRGPLFSSKD